jgi:hypothetical protein
MGWKICCSITGPRMTLATAILLLGICSTGLSAQEVTAPAQSTQQSGSASSSNTQSNQEQNGAVPPATAQEPKPSPTAAPQSTTKAKHHSGKKKGTQKAASNTTCDTANANPGSSPTASEAPGTAGASQTQGSGNAPAKNCPPEKVIVRQGGTTEPSIQLAGGDQTSKNRDEANQMLGSAEANLKKIAGLQLSTAQQGTVSQIRQFVDQSKAALAEGDTDRGRTLAQKAQLLSEDLVTPPK